MAASEVITQNEMAQLEATKVDKDIKDKIKEHYDKLSPYYHDLWVYKLAIE
jgi:hypothetical protein